MLRLKSIFFIFGFMLIGIWMLFFYNKTELHKKYKIAIVQTASHPALNTLAEKVSSVLSEKYKNDILMVHKNAEGMLSNMDSIANQLVCDDSYNAFVCIGSPAAQSLAQIEKNKPIIFGAVTDPYILGIGNQKNICGILDQVDYDSVMHSLQQIMENKTVGILYTVGDWSSEYTIKKLESLRSASGITFKRFGCSNESELISNIESACQSVDMLFLPTDNMIASAVKIVIALAKKYHKPIFMTDTLLFALGGEYAQGVDYQKQGKELALLVESILEKTNNPEEIGIINAKSSGLLVREQY